MPDLNAPLPDDELHTKLVEDWYRGLITLNEARVQLGRTPFESPEADAVFTELPAWTAFEWGLVGLPKRLEDEVVFDD